MKLKNLGFIMVFWSIFGIIASTYFMYDLWFISYDLSTKNINNFAGAVITTLLLITLIIVLSMTICDFWEDLKKWKKSGNWL